MGRLHRWGNFPLYFISLRGSTRLFAYRWIFLLPHPTIGFLDIVLAYYVLPCMTANGGGQWGWPMGVANGGGQWGRPMGGRAQSHLHRLEDAMVANRPISREKLPPMDGKFN